MAVFQGYYTPPHKQYEFNAIHLNDDGDWKVTVPGLDKATFNVTNNEFDNFKNKVVDKNIAWNKYPGTWTSYDGNRSDTAKELIKNLHTDNDRSTSADFERFMNQPGGSTRKHNRRPTRRKPTKRRGSRRGNRKTKKN